MSRKTIILATVVALAAALAACGSDAVPAQPAGPSVVEAPNLVPVFDRQAFVLRDAATDLPVYEASASFTGVEPLFTNSGGIRRCEETAAPLYLCRLADHAVVVRIRRD